MTPRSTYRLQLHKDFTFADARAVAPYLAALGVSHVYVSPILTARRGSMHGYDVVDPTAVNPELGGEPGFRSFVEVLRRHELGIIVDIVPNHMGVGGDDNPWWLDVLRHGAESAYASYFDIDWDTAIPDLRGKLLAPFLGKPYGEVLADGEIALVRHPQHGWIARYYDNVFPIRPEDAAALDERGDAQAAFDPTTAEGRRTLHALLERQHYRLTWWQTAGDMINWRRFFDISGLATLRAELPHVFDASHSLLLDLYAEGLIDGFRVDHVDGLADPGAYCRRLRAAVEERTSERPRPLQGRPWLIVEKILAADETLDPDWGVDGTSGYDFMAELGRVLHDPAGVKELARDWARRTGRPTEFEIEEEIARAEMLARSFSAQLDAAVDPVHALARTSLTDRDRPRAALRRCLSALLVAFRRYRTYSAGTAASPALAEAARRARTVCLARDAHHLDRLEDWLGPVPPDAPDAELRRSAVRRFEQLSAPVAAKAVEDTAFYRHGPLLSLNDVGSDWSAEIGGLADWHARQARRLASFPAAMLASATHDHKRGEDVRARLAVLSERPTDWIALVDAVLPALAAWRELADAPSLVDPGDDIMLVQMIVGAWPSSDPAADGTGLETFRERLAGWQLKALREAKLRSSWDAPNEAYERAADMTLEALLLSPALETARHAILAFVASLTPAATCNGLTQTVLKLCAPGVPDIYQGTEFIDLSLVDPDNRRAVDYAARIAALGPSAEDADATKLAVMTAVLHHRRARPAVFARGSYRPLEVTGPRRDRIIAFAREHAGEAVVAICPRLTARPSAGTADTLVALPPGSAWINILDGTRYTDVSAPLDVGALFAHLPVAVLATPLSAEPVASGR